MCSVGFRCWMLCRRHGFLNLASSFQHQPSLIHKLSLSTSVKSNGWLTNKMAGGRTETLLKNLGYSGFTVHEKHHMDIASKKLYISCAEYSDFPLFKERFGLDDTFLGWLKVLQLHTWMLLVRLSNHNTINMQNDFPFVSKRLGEHMWADIKKRATKIVKGSVRKHVKPLADNYYAALVVYDEGYFTDDKTLADALWKALLGGKEDVEPQQLLNLVDYVHRNMHHLESIPNEELLHGYVSFLPLDSDEPDIEKDIRIQKLLSFV